MSVKEKKVELIELFYDLIYVYAISNMTLLVEEPEGGVITLEMLGVYLVTSMVIIQAWLYMTNYVNRYCTWRWYEYVLVVINMGAAILMSNTITENWLDASSTFVVAMMVMIGCVAVLYMIQIYVQKQDIKAAKHTLDILFVILAVYLVALIMNLIGYREESLFIVVANVFLGMFLPFFKRGEYDLKIVSFPHMVERLELLTIITFGEGIVGITRFFDIMELSPIASMVFMILIFMFGSYVAQVHYLCNHHQVVNANRMTWSHYMIIIAINMVTVSLIYFHDAGADHLFTATLMVVSMAAFYVALMSTSHYYKEEFPWSYKDLVFILIPICIGAAITYCFIGSPYGFLVGALIASGCNFVYIWHKYSSNRCVNVIHTV